MAEFKDNTTEKFNGTDITEFPGVVTVTEVMASVIKVGGFPLEENDRGKDIHVNVPINTSY